MRVASWKAWYIGGRVFCSATHAWADLPDDGMLFLKLYFDERTPDGVQLGQNCSGDDWYWHVPGTDLYAHDSRQTRAEIARRYSGTVGSGCFRWLRRWWARRQFAKRCIKRGKWTTPDEMQRVNADANGQHEFKPCKCDGYGTD
jgi:hypothetical protein